MFGTIKNIKQMKKKIKISMDHKNTIHIINKRFHASMSLCIEKEV